MAVYDFPHRGRAQTARTMYWLASKFKNDLGPLSDMPFRDFHNFVRRIPYVSDPVLFGDPLVELVARPRDLLSGFPGLDCKKKAILVGAWAEKNRVPWELVGMSEQADKEIHHVFPLMWDGDAWVNVDATYPSCTIGQPKSALTYAERFSR